MYYAFAALRVLILTLVAVALFLSLTVRKLKTPEYVIWQATEHLQIWDDLYLNAFKSIFIYPYKYKYIYLSIPVTLLTPLTSFCLSLSFMLVGPVESNLQCTLLFCDLDWANPALSASVKRNKSTLEISYSLSFLRCRCLPRNIQHLLNGRIPSNGYCMESLSSKLLMVITGRNFATFCDWMVFNSYSLYASSIRAVLRIFFSFHVSTSRQGPCACKALHSFF